MPHTPSTSTAPTRGQSDKLPANTGKAPIAPGAASPSDASLPLPHERDESRTAVGTEPQPEIAQAHEDLKSGQVDTDMRAPPGLDADQRKKLVGEETRPDVSPQRG